MYGIFAYVWLIFMGNVDKHTIPMDPMGWVNKKSSTTAESWSVNNFEQSIVLDAMTIHVIMSGIFEIKEV